MSQPLVLGAMRVLWCCLLCTPFFLHGIVNAQGGVAKPAAEDKGYDYKFIPDESVALAIIRPYKFADLDLLKFAVEATDVRHDDEGKSAQLEFIKGFKQIAYFELEHSPSGELENSNIFGVVTFFDGKGMKNFLENLPFPFPYAVLNETSVVIGGNKKEDLKKYHRAPKGSPSFVTDAGWKRVDGGYLACAGDQRIINRLLSELPGSRLGLNALWEKSRYGYLGITVEKRSLVVRVAFEAGKKELTPKLQEGVEFAVGYADNTIPLGKELFRKDMHLPHLKFLFERLNALPQGAKVQSEDGIVFATTSIPTEVPAEVLQSYREYVHAMNIRGYAEASVNKIADALIRYSDDHGHYPQAVILGKDGKGGPPHSWRVEILSMIPDQKEVYDAYRFDEPWDSENNKKLLEKIPFFYLHPADDPKSIFTSYFAITGAATMFAEGKKIGIRDIDDGTDNTIAVVEAKRQVPWTKPEDIPYSSDKPMPKLGGWIEDGWYAGLASGRAEFVKKDVAAKKLKLMFQISDDRAVPDKKAR
ncbi:MAG: DUF1559 domain-containing protein [Planctomycetaceae bacterium]